MTEFLSEKIRQRTFIGASPEEVYDTITSPQKWDAFFTTGMELDPRPGGVCSFSWKDWGPDNYTLKVPGKVLKAERPRTFSFKWGREGKETRVGFDLTATNGGTILTLTEDGYRDTPDDRAMMLECASGWGEALTLLKFYIEHGIVYAGGEKKPRR